MQDTIVAILMSLTPHTTDATEPVPQRQERMEVIALAIADAADRAACFGEWDKPDCLRRFRDRHAMAAALIVLGYAESRFARYVHENRCLDGPRGQRCGVDHKGVPRGRGPWQAWRAGCPELWDQMVDASLDATKAGAWCSARQFASAHQRCQNNNPDRYNGAFSGYRGKSCTWNGAAGRTRLLRNFMAQLYAKPQ